MRALLPLVLVCLTLVLATCGLAARQFAHPDRIRYDAQSLYIEGKPVFIYSGAFHYFRCPKELWRDRFQTIKNAGFNAVETYVAWNWHELKPPKGLEDFSEVNLRDLDDWLTLAEEFGFYVIIRPGPYICSEWDAGGFPQWLAALKPDTPSHEPWYRSDDAQFNAWSRHWYEAVCQVIAPHQLTRKAPGQPGVILFQLENEYDFGRTEVEMKLGHLRALAQAARDFGIDVPLFTCWTKCVRDVESDPLLGQVFDSTNFYTGWNVDWTVGAISELRADQPDAPLMTTELQGGWFSNVGGALAEAQDGLTPAQIQQLTLLVIREGQTLLNYYMLFGGTNFDDRAARGITTTYDYNAPLREHGGVGERYQRVRAIGLMLEQHGGALARSQRVMIDSSASQEDVDLGVRRTESGARYIFIRTRQHEEPRRGQAHFREQDTGFELNFGYSLEAFGSLILYLPAGATDALQGKWLPEPAPAILRPTGLPAPLPLTEALKRDDPGPAKWKPLAGDGYLENNDIWDSHFVFYRVEADAQGSDLAIGLRSGDAVAVALGGKRLIPPGSSIRLPLTDGHHTALLLYENAGHPNGGAGMEELTGIYSLRVKPRQQDKLLSTWRLAQVQTAEPGPEVAPDFDDLTWQEVDATPLEASQLASNSFAVLRTSFEAPQLAQGDSARLVFGRLDDEGWVFLNGAQLAHTANWAQQYTFDITALLKPGTNSLAVIIRNGDGPGGVGEVALESGPPAAALPVEFGRPLGDTEKWYSSKLKQSDLWQRVELGEESGSDRALLTWYRLDFELPNQRRGVWVPWKATLDASGNGFVYLNGHCLGRYWEAGPQREFFLPECWLSFGPESSNQLTLALRPTEQGNSLGSVEIAPYSEFAEYR